MGKSRHVKNDVMNDNMAALKSDCLSLVDIAVKQTEDA